jgi:hypothetical protein
MHPRHYRMLEYAPNDELAQPVLVGICEDALFGVAEVSVLASAVSAAARACSIDE